MSNECNHLDGIIYWWDWYERKYYQISIYRWIIFTQASNAERVSTSRRHHEYTLIDYLHQLTLIISCKREAFLKEIWIGYASGAWSSWWKLEWPASERSVIAPGLRSKFLTQTKLLILQEYCFRWKEFSTRWSSSVRYFDTPNAARFCVISFCS